MRSNTQAIAPPPKLPVPPIRPVDRVTPVPETRDEDTRHGEEGRFECVAGEGRPGRRPGAVQDTQAYGEPGAPDQRGHEEHGSRGECVAGAPCYGRQACQEPAVVVTRRGGDQRFARGPRAHAAARPELVHPPDGLEACAASWRRRTRDACARGAAGDPGGAACVGAGALARAAWACLGPWRSARRGWSARRRRRG